MDWLFIWLWLGGFCYAMGYLHTHRRQWVMDTTLRFAPIDTTSRGWFIVVGFAVTLLWDASMILSWPHWLGRALWERDNRTRHVQRIIPRADV